MVVQSRSTYPQNLLSEAQCISGTVYLKIEHIADLQVSCMPVDELPADDLKGM